MLNEYVCMHAASDGGNSAVPLHEYIYYRLSKLDYLFLIHISMRVGGHFHYSILKKILQIKAVCY